MAKDKDLTPEQQADENVQEAVADTSMAEAERQDDIARRINEDYLKPEAHQELPSDALRRSRGEGLDDDDADDTPDDEDDG